MTFAQPRYRLTTHFSERIPVVKRRMAVLQHTICYLFRASLVHRHVARSCTEQLLRPGLH